MLFWDILSLPQLTELEEMEEMGTRAVASGDWEAKTDRIKCNQCSYKTEKETSMKNHIQSKHDLSFNCEIGPFVCGQKHNLKQHMDSTHMTATPEESEIISSMRSDLAPLSFGEAKAYLLGKIPLWDSMGLLGSPGLGEGLALFGWELQGRGTPRCTPEGKQSLREMFK